MAISRRRSFSVVRIIVTMPSNAVTTTMAETAESAVSAVPIKSPKLLQRHARHDRRQRLLLDSC